MDVQKSFPVFIFACVCVCVYVSDRSLLPSVLLACVFVDSSVLPSSKRVNVYAGTLLAVLILACARVCVENSLLPAFLRECVYGKDPFCRNVCLCTYAGRLFAALTF